MLGPGVNRTDKIPAPLKFTFYSVLGQGQRQTGRARVAGEGQRGVKIDSEKQAESAVDEAFRPRPRGVCISLTSVKASDRHITSVQIP